jgi:hypothetical protein
VFVVIVSMWKLRPNGVHFRCCGPCDPPLTISATQQRQQSDRLKKFQNPTKSEKEGNNCWIKKPGQKEQKIQFHRALFLRPSGGGPLVDNLATFSFTTFLRLHYSLHLPSRPPCSHSSCLLFILFFLKKNPKKRGENPLAGDWSFSKNKNGRRPIRKLNLYQGEDTWPPPDYL